MLGGERKRLFQYKGKLRLIGITVVLVLILAVAAGYSYEANKSIPVVLYDGQETRTIYTAKDTVGEVLEEQGITLDEDDRLDPGYDAEIAENQSIHITRITTKIVEEERPVIYKVVRKADNNLPENQVKTIQKGKNGKAVYRFEVTYKNGREVSRQFINANIVEEKQDQIVAVGTLPVVSRGGLSFTPRRQFIAELTAYGPGVEHTGKGPDDPEYAITRSGVRAREGRTIAVDPNLIPLGWWVYIEGIGYRRAEDTGSAVKGKRIDIYFENDDVANQFGLKKGYKVYVIGPKKPQ